RMGLAGWRFEGGSQDTVHTQPGQPDFAGTPSHFRQRCVGARVLSEVQQPASRVSASLVERCQLGGNQQALSRLEEVTRVETTALGCPAEQSSATRARTI